LPDRLTFTISRPSSSASPDASRSADIGTEREGMTLSVLSTLSRLGIDPWQKAEHLARLPRGAAIDALAGLISTLPASPWSVVEAMTIAARLVLLLPHHAAAPSVAGLKWLPTAGSGSAVCCPGGAFAWAKYGQSANRQAVGGRGGSVGGRDRRGDADPSKARRSHAELGASDDSRR